MQTVHILGYSTIHSATRANKAQKYYTHFFISMHSMLQTSQTAHQVSSHTLTHI